MQRFEKNVFLITGAAGGIGFSIAERAAREGACIVFADTREKEGKEALEKLRRFHSNIEFICLDLTISEKAARFVSLAEEKYGKVDVLINNAGITGKPESIDRMHGENFRHVFECNVMTAANCAQYAVQAMLRQTGECAIVNIASIAGLIGFPGNTAYVASKHALVGMTKSMALDYAARRIRVNAVCPGIIRTPMQESAAKYLTDISQRQRAQSNIPVKTLAPQNRIAAPEEVADAVLFLASPQASHITGAILPVDGGLTAY